MVTLSKDGTWRLYNTDSNNFYYIYFILFLFYFIIQRLFYLLPNFAKTWTNSNISFKCCCLFVVESLSKNYLYIHSFFLFYILVVLIILFVLLPYTMFIGLVILLIMISCFVCLVEYSKGQLATLVTTGKWTYDQLSAHVALSPDLNVVAIGTDSSIFVYSASSGEFLSEIKGVHNGKFFCPFLAWSTHKLLLFSVLFLIL